MTLIDEYTHPYTLALIPNHSKLRGIKPQEIKTSKQKSNTHSINKNSMHKGVILAMFPK